jgi:ABC-2 type transport system permease protein
MNSSISFLRLDYITIKPYLSGRNLLLFLVVFCVVGLGMNQPASLVGMIMMYGMIFCSYPFAVGDQNGIDALYATLPIQRKNIVAGRYLFTISFNLLAGVTAVFFSVAAESVRNGAFSGLSSALISTLVCFALFAGLAFTQLPLYFKLGYSKAKFISYLPLILLTGFIGAVAGFGRQSYAPLAVAALEWLQNNTALFGLALGAALAGLGYLSYKLSLYFYSRREF